MSETTKRRLGKLGKRDEANDLFHKMDKIGDLADELEMWQWQGPVHYPQIQAVIKGSSVTTPLRLVTNSSLVDPKQHPRVWS